MNLVEKLNELLENKIRVEDASRFGESFAPTWGEGKLEIES